MTHTYNIKGMNKECCQEKIEKALNSLPAIKNIEIDFVNKTAIVEMTKHISLHTINKALKKAGDYSFSGEKMIMDSHTNDHLDTSMDSLEVTSWKDYIPLMVILSYIFGGSFLLTYLLDSSIQFFSFSFNWMLFMNMLMGLWFVFFSLFKMLDVKGFAEGYSTYDIVAGKWYGWGLIYPFVELALGIAYLSGFQIFYTSLITFVVLSVASIGVILNILEGRKFQCACLGTILKVPLTKISLIEDLAMAGMALIMMYMIL